jgi:hypothetical protein
MTKELIATATWEQIYALMAEPDMRVGIAGPYGLGKTAGAFDIGKTLSIPVEKVQCHSELAPAEALGMYVPDGTKFRWEPGPIDICYNGGLLILDELVEASGPVKTFLYGALDKGPGGTISYVGRRFEQQDGYRVVATMNEYPDMGGLPNALLDRFDAWFVVTEPSPPLYRMLEPDLRQICRDSYATARDPMQGPPITFRMLFSLQRLRKLPIFSLEQAVYAACYSNKMLAASLHEVLLLSDGEEEDDLEVVADASDSPEDDLGDGVLVDGDDEHATNCACEECQWLDDDDDDD